VSFADPADAVRERIEEMSLSEAARDVDEAVRADTLPDSNVRETVKGRIEERIDDLSAFDRGVADDGDDPDAADEDAAADRDGDGSDERDGARNGDTDEGTDTDGETDADEETDTDGETDADEPTEQRPERSPDDGQVSMEDYL
jgi:hypothetical protein